MSEAPLYGAILAAGRGTRIAPLSDLHPKPLIPTLGRPLWEFHLLSLEALGASPIAVNAHHLGAQLVAAAERWPRPILVSHEKELLGTGGGLLRMAELLYKAGGGAGTVAVINGDALFDFDPAPALAAHRASGAAATVVLRPTTPGDPFGRIETAESGEVLRISEVEGPRAGTGTQLGAFTGLQFVEASLVERLEERPSDTFRSGYRRLFEERLPINSFFVDPTSLWIDVGTPERHFEAHWSLLARPESPLWTHIPGERHAWGVLGEGAEVDPTATLKGPVWLGPGARITAQSTLSRSVLWPAVEASGDQESTLLCGPLKLNLEERSD